MITNDVRFVRGLPRIRLNVAALRESAAYPREETNAAFCRKPLRHFFRGGWHFHCPCRDKYSWRLFQTLRVWLLSHVAPRPGQERGLRIEKDATPSGVLNQSELTFAATRLDARARVSLPISRLKFEISKNGERMGRRGHTRVPHPLSRRSLRAKADHPPLPPLSISGLISTALL